MRINSIYFKIMTLCLGMSLLSLVGFAVVAHYDTEIILRIHVLQEQIPGLFNPENIVNDGIYDVSLSPEENIEKTLEALKFWYFIDLLLPFVIISVLCLFLANRIVRPIKFLTRISRQIMAGDYSIIPQRRSNDEIGDLAEAFGEMVTTVQNDTKKIREQVESITKKEEQSSFLSQKLQKALEKVQSVDEIKSRFLTVTSHELRTPLTPIRAHTEMLVAGMSGKINDDQKKSLELILNKTVQLDSLIGNILDITRIADGSMNLDLSSCDLVQIVTRCVDQFKEYAQSKGVTLELRAQKGITLISDSEKIATIVQNTISNAVEFTNSGGKVIVNIILNDVTASIIIQDSGIGVAPESLDRIFKPFEQVDSSFSRSHEGVGLGLPIARGLTKCLGGEYNFESVVGKGTHVAIHLPRESKHSTIRKKQAVFGNKTVDELLEEEGLVLTDTDRTKLYASDLIDEDGLVKSEVTIDDLQKIGILKNLNKDIDEFF